jgi:hypothetical protein
MTLRSAIPSIVQRPFSAALCSHLLNRDRNPTVPAATQMGVVGGFLDRPWKRRMAGKSRLRNIQPIAKKIFILRTKENIFHPVLKYRQETGSDLTVFSLVASSLQTDASHVRAPGRVGKGKRRYSRNPRRRNSASLPNIKLGVCPSIHLGTTGCS